MQLPKDDDRLRAFAQIAHDRHSCRAFRPEPLAPERIEMLLRLAQRAPSDCNSQGWKTWVVSGAPLEALREALHRQAAEGGPADPDVPPVTRYEGVLLDRRRACGWGLYEAVGIARGDREASRAQALQNFRLFGAPHLAVITAEASLGERGLFGAGIYMGFLLLAAEAMGIGAIPQAAVSHHAGLLRQHLGIPPEQRIVSALSFGMEDADHPANRFRTDRAGVEDAAVLIDG